MSVDHRARLIELARGTAWLMDALRAVRSLGLESWCLGAGAIRNLVWDALSGHQRPSALPDVDVAFSFRDRTAAKRYAERWPGVTIMPV